MDLLNIGFHPSKSHFMTVNVNDDLLALVMDSVVVTHTDEYVYMGTPISNNKISDQLDRQIKLKNGHVLKCVSFISKIRDTPFTVKFKVWKSTIIYACET